MHQFSNSRMMLNDFSPKLRHGRLSYQSGDNLSLLILGFYLILELATSSSRVVLVLMESQSHVKILRTA